MAKLRIQLDIRLYAIVVSEGQPAFSEIDLPRLAGPTGMNNRALNIMR